MKEYENYRVHCRLKELMHEGGRKVGELHRAARISKETISQLRGNSSKAVSTRAIAHLCGELNVGIGELFEVLPEDIWMPIRLAREVTVHFGSRAVTAPEPVRAEDAAMLSCQFVGCWDIRAFQCISEYLIGLNRDIRVRLEEHITGAGRGIDPAVKASARGIFERGNHVVIGSQIANQFTEEVVCHAYDVAPYNPQMRTAFPYGFEWDHWRQVRSSFGWQGHRKHFGIAALPSNEIVAPSAIVAEGEGPDGALILVYRLFTPLAQRNGGDDDERIIICLLGYSGPGTLAAAQLATNPEHAAGLYPASRKVPRMRAVACTYFRRPGAKHEDNREVTSVSLIPEKNAPGAAQTGAEPPKRAAGGKRRRGR
jgi:DNA-binding Xre family transcriptional regulator